MYVIGRYNARNIPSQPIYNHAPVEFVISFMIVILGPVIMILAESMIIFCHDTSV